MPLFPNFLARSLTLIDPLIFTDFIFVSCGFSNVSSFGLTGFALAFVFGGVGTGAGESFGVTTVFCGSSESGEDFDFLINHKRVCLSSLETASSTSLCGRPA